jgi:hypothetical protein
MARLDDPIGLDVQLNVVTRAATAKARREHVYL